VRAYEPVLSIVNQLAQLSRIRFEYGKD
jgi:hypothetical protein